eukprot:4070427-Pyramimonas_sp.AAC.1
MAVFGAPEDACWPNVCIFGLPRRWHSAFVFLRFAARVAWKGFGGHAHVGSNPRYEDHLQCAFSRRLMRPASVVAHVRVTFRWSDLLREPIGSKSRELLLAQ